MHLVCFIIGVYHDARSPKRQIRNFVFSGNLIFKYHVNYSNKIFLLLLPSKRTCFISEHFHSKRVTMIVQRAIDNKLLSIGCK